MTTKHPIARLFLFCSKMEHLFTQPVYDRYDIYMDYISSLSAEERIDFYKRLSISLMDSLDGVKTITRSDIINCIPDRWPCVEWFDDNNVDFDKYEKPKEVVAVFDYIEIIHSMKNEDHTRLIMLLLLDAVKSAGSKGCGREMDNISDQITDEALLSEYGFGGGAEILAVARGVLNDFTPTGAAALNELIDVYNSSSGDFSVVLEHATEKLLKDDTLPMISNEISTRSKLIASEPGSISSNIRKISDAVGVRSDYAQMAEDISTEIMSDPNGALEIITTHASNFTGVDKESLRGVANNIRKVVPVDEIEGISQVVRESIESENTGEMNTD